MSQFRVVYTPGAHDCRPNESEELRYFEVNSVVECAYCGREWRCISGQGGHTYWQQSLVRHRSLFG